MFMVASGGHAGICSAACQAAREKAADARRRRLIRLDRVVAELAVFRAELTAERAGAAVPDVPHSLALAIARFLGGMEQ